MVNNFGIFWRILIQSVLSFVRAFAEIVKSYFVKIYLLHSLGAKIKRERHCYFLRFILFCFFSYNSYQSKS